MTDPLFQKELQDYQDYRNTYLSTVMGQRVLADLVDKFYYNRVALPATEMDMAKLDGSRDVIRYIIGKLGFQDETLAFVKALGLVSVPGPRPLDETSLTE